MTDESILDEYALDPNSFAVCPAPKFDTTNADYYLSPLEILSKIAEFIKKFDLYTKIGTQKEIYHIRFGLDKDGQNFSTFKDISAPPAKFATQPNRMSPPGISMFYAAFDSATALLETSSPVNDGDSYSMGKLTPKYELNLVDLTKIPEKISIFDTERSDDLYARQFLIHYIKEISRPVNKSAGYSNIDYVPTQILTEFIRYGMDHANDTHGIQYRSSKSTSGKERVSLVLFMDHEETMKNLDLVELSHHICHYEIRL